MFFKLHVNDFHTLDLSTLILQQGNMQSVVRLSAKLLEYQFSSPDIQLE